jgi:hypothetical protein
MPLTLCQITGTIYKPDTATLVAAAGAKLYVKVEKNSVIIGTGTMAVTADEDGEVSFSVPRNSQIFVQGNATIGSSTDLTNGKSFTVPDASTATLESLAAVSTVPATGITVVGLANKIGIVEFDDTYFAVAESPTGVANITIDADALLELLDMAPSDVGALSLLGFI